MDKSELLFSLQKYKISALKCNHRLTNMYKIYTQQKILFILKFIINLCRMDVFRSRHEKSRFKPTKLTENTLSNQIVLKKIKKRRRL